MGNRTFVFVPARRTRWLPSVVAAALTMLVLSALVSADAAEQSVRTFRVSDSFENVKDQITDEIIKRGFVVDYTAHIGAMLARTAGDVGSRGAIYADAQALQFCSATLSRRMMEADAANIGFCPHVIFIYTLPGAAGVTHVGYRPLPRVGSAQSTAAIDAVNAMLDGIVRAAAGQK